MKNKLSARERMLLTFFLFTLLVSVSFRFLLLPSFAGYIAAKDQLILLKLENSTENIDARVVKEAQALDSEKKRWESLIAGFPRKSAGGIFISELGRMSAGKSVIVKSIRSSPAVYKSGIGIQPYSLELQGSYENIICVMKVLGEGGCLVNMKNVKFAAAGGDKDNNAVTELNDNNYDQSQGNLLTGPVLARLELDVYNLPGD